MLAALHADTCCVGQAINGMVAWPAGKQEQEMTDKKRTRGTAYTHVVMAYLDKGISAVEAIYLRGNLTKETIKTAIRNLRDREREVADFEAWYSDTFGVTVGAPKPGETRVYSAQTQKDSETAFIKLPLPGVAKKAQIEAHFGSDGTVTVRPAA